MKPSHLFACLAIVLACAVAQAQKSAIALVPAQAQDYMPPQIFQLSGTCTAELTPDKAIIMGGVSSGAVKPTDAVAQLDKQVDLMRGYVEENHGRLELMERVRTLKTPQPGREDPEPPFQVVQRFQADFPAGAPVDAILQKLIELGMDRFGDNMLNNYNRREAVIRFRVSEFDARMRAMQDVCTADAWKEWCATAGAGQCSSDKSPANLELVAFNVRSQESLLRPDGGGSMPWQFSSSRMQRAQEPMDLLGNVTLHLDGTILLTYRVQPKEPPKEAQP